MFVSATKSKRRVSQFDPDTGLEHHSVHTCLACYKIRHKQPVTSTIDEDGHGEDDFTTEGPDSGVTTGTSAGPSPVSGGIILSAIDNRHVKCHNSSLVDMLTSAMPGSITSTASLESGKYSSLST